MSRTRGHRRSRNTCRERGGCPWCDGNRTHATERRVVSAEEQLREDWRLLDPVLLDLEAADRAALVEALERPPEPWDALRAAWRVHP